MARESSAKGGDVPAGTARGAGDSASVDESTPPHGERRSTPLRGASETGDPAADAEALDRVARARAALVEAAEAKAAAEAAYAAALESARRAEEEEPKSAEPAAAATDGSDARVVSETGAAGDAAGAGGAAGEDVAAAHAAHEVDAAAAAAAAADAAVGDTAAEGTDAGGGVGGEAGASGSWGVPNNGGAGTAELPADESEVRVEIGSADPWRDGRHNAHYPRDAADGAPSMGGPSHWLENDRPLGSADIEGSRTHNNNDSSLNVVDFGARATPRDAGYAAAEYMGVEMAAHGGGGVYDQAAEEGDELTFQEVLRRYGAEDGELRWREGMYDHNSDDAKGGADDMVRRMYWSYVGLNEHGAPVATQAEWAAANRGAVDDARRAASSREAAPARQAPAPVPAPVPAPAALRRAPLSGKVDTRWARVWVLYYPPLVAAVVAALIGVGVHNANVEPHLQLADPNSPWEPPQLTEWEWLDDRGPLAWRVVVLVAASLSVAAVMVSGLKGYKRKWVAGGAGVVTATAWAFTLYAMLEAGDQALQFDVNGMTCEAVGAAMPRLRNGCDSVAAEPGSGAECRYPDAGAERVQLDASGSCLCQSFWVWPSPDMPDEAWEREVWANNGTDPSQRSRRACPEGSPVSEPLDACSETTEVVYGDDSGLQKCIRWEEDVRLTQCGVVRAVLGVGMTCGELQAASTLFETEHGLFIALLVLLTPFALPGAAIVFAVAGVMIGISGS